MFVNNQTKWNEELAVGDNEGKYVQVYVEGGGRKCFYSFPLDCLQSVFSLKIRGVLISASAIANHDVMFQWGIGTRRGRLRPRLSRFAVRGSRLACVLEFRYPVHTPSMFSLRVRRARVIKYKPRGIYWSLAPRGSEVRRHLWEQLKLALFVNYSSRSRLASRSVCYRLPRHLLLQIVICIIKYHRLKAPPTCELGM